MLDAIDWHFFFFVLFALVACAFALVVLFSNNIVRMAFSLVLSLGAVAGLFFLAGAEFVGAMQLMIYVGGTMVLLVFGVMLTAHSRFVQLKAPGGEWVIALVVGGMLLVLLVRTAFMVNDWRSENREREAVVVDESKSTTAIGLALSGVRVDKQDGVVRSGYLLPFVIVSMHLLVVLIGAAYLARAKKRVDRDTT
ncbi:MAG: NADH-quinone oxidoreductase subunit J [Planctomycetes bacterium]|nr:NADH-quinone oxidoreductase subunit J [Planctomycetota bacterium]MBL7040244.1 NADH-quinone oxidoreductase subunit J [Pirellulaceae bacterium]